MKNLKYVVVGFCLIGSISVFGQEGEISHEDNTDKSELATKKHKTPTEKAIAQTDKMKVQLGLTDEQYQKVYELNVKVNMKIEAIRNDPNMSDEKQREFIRGNKRDRETVLNTILTDEQKQKREELKAARKAEHKKRDELRDEETE